MDVAGFDAAMDKQKAAGRAAGKFRMDRALEYTGAGHPFTGYEKLEEPARVAALYKDGAPVQQLAEGELGVVVLDTTPFYAESGGQVGDCGVLAAEGVQFGVEDTQKIKADVYGHHGTQTQGTLKVGDAMVAKVDVARRHATMRNHSVTHLMHKALREVLGGHVQQKGSLVDADKTRFDFTHNQPVTEDQVREIERRVNAEILENRATEARVMDIESAKATGAMMLFGEKYGDSVRVLDIGSSRELCGGTHVQRTGDIGLFKIVSEGGVAAGIRRVEAVTGANALDYLQELEATVQGAAAALKAPVPELQPRIGQVLEQVRALEKELAAAQGQAGVLAGRRTRQPGGGRQGHQGAGRHARRRRRPDAARNDGQAQGQAQERGHRAGGGGRRQGAAGGRRHGGPHRQGQGRRAGQLRRPAGGRQGRRQARHGDGRRHRRQQAAGGVAVGAGLGGRASLSRKPHDGAVKILSNIFSAIHGVIALLFAAAAVVLVLIAVRIAWAALGDGLNPGSALVVIESLGLLAAAVVALQIAQTVFEEEIVRDAQISAPTRVRRFLSRFLVVVVVALAIEGLVAAFKAIHEEMAELRYASALLLSTAALLAAWGVFVRLNRAAEELEPEAMEEAKREDRKLE